MAKILIVDDDKTITELMKALMSMEGHQPKIVNYSTSAMEAAQDFHPDMITLDLMMPGLSGFDLCQQFRADPQFANTPILIVSAKDDPASKQKAIQLGANDYMTKPFSVTGLLDKIKELTTSK